MFNLTVAYDEWASFSLKNDIYEICEIVAPLFKERVTDAEGNPARFISIANIDYEETNLGEIIEYQVKMDLHSDQGESMQSILIREFRNSKDMQDELNHYSLVEQRSVPFPDIGPEPMLHINQEKKFIIYAKIEGYTINQLSLAPEIVNFLIGRIKAVLQGEQIYELNENIFRELMIFLLMNLPFTDEERDSIVTILETQFKKISGSRGGYIPCTQIDHQEIVLFPTYQVSSINTDLINQGQGFNILVPLEIPENLSNDRLADIASSYHETAFKEFIETGDVQQTKQAIIQFLQGYNGVSQALNVPSLMTLYPNGNTLDLHFVSEAWLAEAEKVPTEPVNYDDFERRDVLRYTYFILLNEPFSELVL